MTIERAREVLLQHFGYSKLKPAQEEVIAAALRGDDVLGVLPTGYGKSVCFQIPALMREGCAIVISPLIALMKDQVDNALKRGIPASFINSTLDADEMAARLSDLRAGAYKLFYVAPERISSPAFLGVLDQTDVSFVVIDEAHCASIWGHDFRPSFSRIHEIVQSVEKSHKARPTVIALTATATADIESDIARSVGMRNEYVRVIGDPVRANLTYGTIGGNCKWDDLRDIGRTLFKEPGRHLVYLGTRNGTTAAADIFAKVFGEKVVSSYHAGMLPEERTRVQNDFVAGKLRIVCATNAFGMGIDIPDIRSVVHFGICGSLESYAQETGRAGRDGKPSTVMLLENSFSDSLQERFVDAANPPIELYRALWQWLLASRVRMVRLSAREIAEQLSVPGIEPTDAMVSNALNIMEKAKLVQRDYFAYGTPIVIDTDNLRAEFPKLKNSPQAVAAHILNRATRIASKGVVELGVDLKEEAEQIGIASSTFRAALKSLEPMLRMGATFTGKSTIVIRRDLHTPQLMETCLPVEQLQRKAKRDYSRLDAMRRYASLRTNEERKDFIRSYFRGEVLQPAK